MERRRELLFSVTAKDCEFQATSGDCKHWVRAANYRWGECNCPLPRWVEELEDMSLSSPLFPDDEKANNCDMFETGGH